MLARLIADLGKNLEHKVLLDALVDKQSGAITQMELTEICIKWTYEFCLGDLKFSEKPEMPYSVMEFFSKDIKTRNKAIEKRGYMYGQVMSYLTDLSKVETKNRSNFAWLKRMESCFKYISEPEKAANVKVLLDGYSHECFSEWKAQTGRK